MSDEELEELCIRSAANMGITVFDRIVDCEDGITRFYDGDRLSMMMNTESWNQYLDLLKTVKSRKTD